MHDNCGGGGGIGCRDKLRNMIIGFDGRYAEGDLVGVGKYIRSLVLELSKKGITCVLFYSKKPKTKIEGRNIKSRVLNSKNRYIFEQILLPLALKRERVDIYHATGNVGVPILCPIPSILTVHDIIPLGVKDYFSYSPFPFLSKTSYLFRLKTSLSRASKIATDSLFVKGELIKNLHIPSDKIKVIPLGASRMVKEGALPKILSGRKYILNHGGVDIRKNIDMLIKAFSEVHKVFKDIKLVITGKNDRMKKDLDILIDKLGLSGSIIFTGYTDDKTLSAIVRGADLICYPTLSEGFGFPVLEGFGAGVPVISSARTAIPEIAGDAALLINPESSGSISGAIEKVLNDPKLAKSMVLKGKRRYNEFKWEKTANEYIGLYNSIE